MTKAKKPLQEYDVLPGDILRDEYGFNASSRPQIFAIAEEVPSHLQPMIPLVKKWAIPCDVTRHDVFDVEGEQAVANLYYDALDYVKPINDWLDSLRKNRIEWSESAYSFMYFLKAHGEAYQPTPEELKEQKQRLAKRQSELERKKDIETGLQAFSEKDYLKCFENLKKHVEVLDGSMLLKYKLSAKKTEQNQT